MVSVRWTEDVSSLKRTVTFFGHAFHYSSFAAPLDDEIETVQHASLTIIHYYLVEKNNFGEFVYSLS